MLCVVSYSWSVRRDRCSPENGVQETNDPKADRNTLVVGGLQDTERTDEYACPDLESLSHLCHPHRSSQKLTILFMIKQATSIQFRSLRVSFRSMTGAATTEALSSSSETWRSRRGGISVYWTSGLTSKVRIRRGGSSSGASRLRRSVESMLADLVDLSRDR